MPLLVMALALMVAEFFAERIARAPVGPVRMRLYIRGSGTGGA